MLSFAAGLLAGAVAVLAAWQLSGSADAQLVDDPGIPPPEYAYLDNARVLAYLSQIEGGLSTSERRTRQATSGGTGGVSAGGVQVNANSTRQEFVEQVVTPTATTRFYRLLDRLGAKGYLEEVDAAAAPAELARAFADVDEGEFVRLRGCRLQTPTYARVLGLIRRSRVPLPAIVAWGESSADTEDARSAAVAARTFANPDAAAVGAGVVAYAPEVLRSSVAAGARYAKAVAPDPPVAYASCRGEVSLQPRGVDLLFPLRLNALSGVDSLLAGPVTIVGKVVRRVRTDADTYVDADALAAFSRPVEALDEALGLTEPVDMLSSELATDVTVLPPGAVILPVAIYK